jgi:hypothetical protein
MLNVLYHDGTKEKTMQVKREGNKYFISDDKGNFSEIERPQIHPILMELRRTYNVLSMTGTY